jgi:hypothetical protein
MVTGFYSEVTSRNLVASCGSFRRNVLNSSRILSYHAVLIPCCGPTKLHGVASQNRLIILTFTASIFTFSFCEATNFYFDVCLTV